MSTRYPDLFAALAAPFATNEVKSFTKAGRTFAYVTARTIMNRLDDVLGPENWWDEYTPLENSVICRLTIRLPDGTTLTKADAGGYAGMSDSGDDDKSGYSDAYKRAAVKFGVGRYLYRDGVPTFVATSAVAEAKAEARQEERPLGKFLEDAAKFAGVPESTLVDDVLAGMVEDEKVKNELRDVDTKFLAIANIDRHERKYVRDMIAALVKHYRSENSNRSSSSTR